MENEREDVRRSTAVATLKPGSSARIPSRRSTCQAIRHPVAAPSLPAASITSAPVTLALTTCGADDDTVWVSASSSGSTNAWDTSTFRVSSGPIVGFGGVTAVVSRKTSASRRRSKAAWQCQGAGASWRS